MASDSHKPLEQFPKVYMIYCSPCLQLKGDKTKKLTFLVLLAVIIMSFITISISGLLSITIFGSEASSLDSVGINVNPSDLHYGIVIDCGSSGSRVYVYFWPPHSGNPHDLLNIQQLMDHNNKPVVKKIEPGLDRFGDKPEEASDYIEKLLEFAADYIPQAKHKETPLYILATAGLRMIPKESQDKIMKDLYRDIPKKFEFAVAENHFEVISGKTEGIYAWIAVNYALNRFSHSPDTGDMISIQSPDGSTHLRSRTVGMIDMGGGSVQITFEVVNEDQFSNIPRELVAELNLGCQEKDAEHTYRLYATTFLGFGANSVIKRYQASLADKYPSKLRNALKKRPIPDPCFPSGMPLTEKVEQGRAHFIGSGNYLQCKANLEPLLNLSVPCSHISCSFNGVHQPKIDFINATFYGFSEFWYTTEDVYGIGGLYSYDKFESAAQDFCGTNWEQLDALYKEQKYPHADAHRFKYECLKSAWLSAVLHKGFQFPTDYRKFQSAQLIGGKDVQWTMGAIIYRTRFLPLRDLDQTVMEHSPVSSWSKFHLFYNEYLIIICFIVVLAAIFLYMKRLRLCPKHADLSRVPSMSYFMTEENQLEQGVYYAKSLGYISGQ